MKINKIIILSTIGLFLIVSTCSAAWSIDNDYLNSNTGSGSGTAYEPVANPAAGNYTSSQSVSLSATGASSIRYTIDDSTPSCTVGLIYSSSSPISIGVSTSATTIKAISCYADNGADSSSNVVSKAYTFSCPSVSNAATYNAYPTCGPATCSSGYTLSGGACVASGGGGGGGGGSATTYCSSVTYGDWATTCFSGTQFRSALTQTPTGCSLTSAQQLAAQRACEVTPPITETPPASDNTGTPPVFDSGAIVLQNIATESGIMDTNNRETLLIHLGDTANLAQEQAGLIKYKTILGLDKNISAADKTMINYFLVYGTRSTQRLGAGERAAVINSYYQAYHRLPNSEAEWSDVLKIASGRWPVERSVAAEAQAKIEFKKVYLRNADMTKNIDENAVMVIAYGLLPLQRNLNSEKVAIKTFRYVYGHNPVNALAWNIVRSIAYSGAKR